MQAFYAKKMLFYILKHKANSVIVLSNIL